MKKEVKEINVKKLKEAKLKTIESNKIVKK
jgi:hypothetical protein